MKTWATAVFCAPAILAVLGYFGPEALDRYEQHKARQADEVRVKELNQNFEEQQRGSKWLQQRLEELRNDARQLELRRGGPMPIPPTHPPDDRPIDI